MNKNNLEIKQILRRFPIRAPIKNIGIKNKERLSRE